MNNRGGHSPPPPPFNNSTVPWSAYVPGPHSSLSPPQRFPYNVSGARSPHGYASGGVIHGSAGYGGPPSVFRTHATSPPQILRTHATSPPSVIRNREYTSPDRYSRLSATSSPRRRFPDDDVLPENEPVVFNAGFSFRMGKENSVIHKHVDIQPAHAIPEAPSSGLTRQIDKFLQKSDHTFDRYHNVIHSRSGGKVSGNGHRGKSMTPGGVGGRDDSPEPSTLGLSSYRSQRSTSAASIAVKAEKHLESLSRNKGEGGNGKKSTAAPIAEHEEDHLDDELSSSDSSLDGFDTDDDVPRSTDVFDISDDTSADLSKLSAIEVDPTTQCSTPFDPSRLDDLSSDSDDEYFDVVPLPGLRPPQLPSPQPPSTSPLPEHQQKAPQGNALQEPLRGPPTHSQSMPAVNKGITTVKMGNNQAQLPNTTTEKGAASTAENTTSSPRKIAATETVNLANAINTLAPPSSTKSKADSAHKAPNKQNSSKAESVSKGEGLIKEDILAKTLNSPQTENRLKAAENRLKLLTARKDDTTPIALSAPKPVNTHREDSTLVIEDTLKSDNIPIVESTTKTGVTPKALKAAESISKQETIHKEVPVPKTSDTHKAVIMQNAVNVPKTEIGKAESIFEKDTNQKSEAVIMQNAVSVSKTEIGKTESIFEKDTIQKSEGIDSTLKIDITEKHKSALNTKSAVISDSNQETKSTVEKESSIKTEFTAEKESTIESESISKSGNILKTDTAPKATYSPKTEITSKGKIASKTRNTHILESTSKGVETTKAENVSETEVECTKKTDGDFKAKSTTEITPILENISKVKSTSKAQITPKAENVSKVEGTPKAENISKVEGSPKDENISKVGGTPKAENISKVGVTPKAENISKVGGTPKAENISKVEDTPKEENTSKVEGTHKAENTLNIKNTEKAEIMAKEKIMPIGESAIKSMPEIQSASGEETTLKTESEPKVKDTHKAGCVTKSDDSAGISEVSKKSRKWSVKKPVAKTSLTSCTPERKEKKDSESQEPSGLSCEPKNEEPQKYSINHKNAKLVDSAKEPPNIATKTEKFESGISNKACDDTETTQIAESSKKDVAVNEALAAQNNLSPKSKNALPSDTSDYKSIKNHPLAHTDATINDNVASIDSSAKKETIDALSFAAVKEETNEKLAKPQQTKKTPQRAPGSCKVRAGSPIPDKSAVMGVKITSPVLTGKLQITPNSGPGPPDSGKESLTGNNGKASFVQTKDVDNQVNDSKVNADDKSLIPKKALVDMLEKKTVDTDLHKQEGKDSSEKVSEKKSDDQINGKEVENLKEASKIKDNSDKASMKVIGNQLKEKEIVNLDAASKTVANSKVDRIAETGEKNDSKPIKLNESSSQPNKTSQPVKTEFDAFNTDGKEDIIDNDFSEIETFVDRSRCSSVASDTSRTMSPDISLRSGAKRTKSEKLSAIMNLWESEDVSQVSERSKPKSAKTPKVGKISGLKNMFEAGKATEKADPLSSPNLVKLKSSSGTALADPKALLPKKTIAGATGIATINAAKFGGTSKFKKPSECTLKDGEKALKRESSALSKKDLKANNQSVAVSNNQKDKSSIGNLGKLEKDSQAKENTAKDESNAKLEKDKEQDKELVDDKQLDAKDGKTSNELQEQGSTKSTVGEVKSEKVVNGIVTSVESSQSGGSEVKEIKKKKKKKGKGNETSSDSVETGETDAKRKPEDNNKSNMPHKENTVGAIESPKTETNNSEAKQNHINSENIVIEKAQTKGAEVTSSVDERVTDVSGNENKFIGSKTLGGIKSFIETVAKGGKTLEDKLSKTGIHVGKKSIKVDNQKDSPTFESKSKKKTGQTLAQNVSDPVATVPAQDLHATENAMIKATEDVGKTKLDYKQALAKAVPALESEVEALIKEASVLLEPKEIIQPPVYSPPSLTLPTREILSVASFPDAAVPVGGDFSVTSLPSSPTKDSQFYFGDQYKPVMSLPASPTKEVHFHFEESQKNSTSEEGEDEVFVDAIDPGQLDTLMPLPDMQIERDRRSRSRTPMDIRERSVTPSPVVAQSEAILSETDRILRRSRSNKSLRRSYSRSLSSAALNKLSEVTADLSEEHTTAHLAGERLEAEQAERMKLEKDVDRLQTDVKRMTSANGKLEMEKLALRSEVLSAAELNGDMDDDDEAADASLYKRKYEWCLREIELLKKQLKQQQEDDLDQLLLLKKQLEKKVADAYEETDEQRQVVAQLKRKSQRLQAEMNDLKILLEEQTSRNNLLEKKQRKFDQEMMTAQEELRHERANKEKIQRERDQILSEKYSFEQEVTTLKLELELKEEKVLALNRELDDLTSSGKVEEEVATLKKAKHDLELRIKDQEEELDDLAGQVQMLEGAKVRLEMSMEQMRKENRREVSQREEELEEVRLSAQKKIKSLEAQLENEHEERTLLVREKHEQERRIADLQDRTITHVDEDYVHKLKKELKKTKALLRDTQTMLEKAQSEGSHKLLLRQLKTQLEDAEFAKTAAIKARQCADADLSEVSGQLDEALRSKKEAEDKCGRISKEKAEIHTQLEESEEEVAEVMKKYKATVSQLSVDQITLSEQSQQIAELEHSKQVLQERMLELSSKVEVLEGETANIHTQRRLEMKIKEMESKLELELTTRQRLESQIGRLKDQIERLSGECDAARLKESQASDQSKRLGRQLRDAKEDLSNVQQRYTEASNKKSELEKQLELSDAEVITLKSDLKLAFKRIEDLQQAIQGDISDSDSDLSDSDSDSDGSLSSYLTASLRHQRSSSNSTLRTPPSEVQQLERLELPNSPCSEAMSAISEDLDDASTKESFA